MNMFFTGQEVFFAHNAEHLSGVIEEIRGYGRTRQYQIRRRDKVYKILEDDIISPIEPIIIDIQALVDL